MAKLVKGLGMIQEKKYILIFLGFDTKN